MARRSKPKFILEACRLSWDGNLDVEIAGKLGVTITTISKWRKHPIWIEFESELIAKYKSDLMTLSENTQTAS